MIETLLLLRLQSKVVATDVLNEDTTLIDMLIDIDNIRGRSGGCEADIRAISSLETARCPWIIVMTSANFGRERLTFLLSSFLLTFHVVGF
jgi:hypothetical protein